MQTPVVAVPRAIYRRPGSVSFPLHAAVMGGATTTAASAASPVDPSDTTNNNINNSASSAAPRDCGVLSRVQPAAAVSAQDLETEVWRLRAENEKLRFIEEQFWALLKENEDLKKVVSERGKTAMGCGNKMRDAHNEHVGASRDEEVWRLSSCTRALRECIELLLARELESTVPDRDHKATLHAQLEQGDSVASYLLWLRSKQRREVANDAAGLDHAGIVDGRHTTESSAALRIGGCSPNGGKLVAVTSPRFSDGADATLMRCQLEDTKCALQETRDMLELTNVSRVAALNDCARMSEEVSTLTAHLEVILKNSRASRDLCVENEALSALVEKQARDINIRDQLLRDMRTTLQQLRTARSEEEISLAEETERARHQLLTRRAT
ncbi:hypothetical protein DQ04_00281140 [Trypanosoma grayi]|uniref:hypothetical protein n=1 Tax=Trypanosoma grayi TaxID=71804 RepID=UPI0004F3F5C2|nr:hypothetical protein DQ04_00281140 [Trypanosoma grayi]KEG14851.1 hypothetical protein DQ04_00281140 [Trypanosoma grayi]